MACKTLTAGLTPTFVMLDKRYPMENRHFEPFFFWRIFFFHLSLLFSNG